MDLVQNKKRDCLCTVWKLVSMLMHQSYFESLSKPFTTENLSLPEEGGERAALEMTHKLTQSIGHKR